MPPRHALLSISLALLLNACGFGPRSTPTAVPSPTPTAAPTSVPTPASPLAILVLPEDMDKAQYDAYQKAVYELAQGSGMRFQVRNKLTPADLEAGLKVVVVLPPDPGLAALAASAPQVQFLAINIPEVSAGNNISVLAANTQVDIPAFLAGYIAAMLAQDYHAGMIFPKDDPQAEKAWAAFQNGMAFYCGLCRPFYYSPYGFPQSVAIPADEKPERLGGWANYLVVERRVEVVYVYPDPRIASPSLFDSLALNGALILSTFTLNPKPVGWVATIRPDEIRAIQTAWPALISAQGGLVIPSPLGLADVDASLLSPGKERQAQQVLDDLLAGRISTGISP